MHRFGFKQVAPFVGILLGVVLFAGEASATTTGMLDITGVGPVIVGIGSVDWTPPIDGTNGSFNVTAGTTLTSAAGNPAVGSTGLLLDLTPTTVLPLANFITFSGVSGLGFDLSGVGPGSSNTACAGLAVGSSCSIFAGSPIVLTAVQVGSTVETSVSLGAFGTAHDGTSPNSIWTGDFTTQIPDETPGQIQMDFGCPSTPSTPVGDCTNPTMTKTSSYSGSFVASVTSVPEPGTLGLLGIGLVSLVALYRKNKEKVM